MKKYILSLLLILILATQTFGVGVIRVESENYFEGLSPSLLTTYKALHFVPGDVLNISTGSLVGNTGVVYENLDPHNATFWAWIKLDAGGNAGQVRTLFHCYNSATDYIWIYINASNNLVLDVCGTSTLKSASTSVSTILPQTWTHIACTWSKNTDVNGTNNLYVYVNGSGAGSTTAPTALSAIPATFSVGMDANGRNCLSGSMAWKLTRYWMASTDITNDYNSGNGSAGFFTVTNHTVALGLTSENSTGIVASHRGCTVSAILDGSTEDTLTVASNATNRFADNDRVIVSAGNGYSSNIIGNTFVDGSPSSTSVNVDDGAGADVGTLEKIGKSLSFDGVDDYVDAGNGASLQMGTGNFSVSAWINTTQTGIDRDIVAHQNQKSPFVGWLIRLNDFANNGKVAFRYSVVGAVNQDTLSNGVVNDGKWHHILCKFDTNTIYIYIDGKYDKSMVVTTGSVNPATSLKFGWGYDYFNGFIDDVRIYNRALSADEVLWEATHPSCSFAELHAGITVGTHETTLTAQANSGQKVLTVADSSTFTANEVIRIVGATPETVTIATIDSPTQMSTVANLVNTAANGSAVKFSNLVLFQKYSDGVATDLSIYGNDGTVSGATYTQSAFIARNLFTDGDMEQ